MVLSKISSEVLGGLALALAAFIAMIWANSEGAALYNFLLSLPIAIRIGDYELMKTLLHWVNDGLMAVFFLTVGAEIKQEIMQGELNSPRKATLPFIAALGGMLVPALVYSAFNLPYPSNLSGWAIPTATDIAFSLGILSLLGQRVPTSLKAFLLALAVIDDLGGIIIIAIFYTAQLSTLALGFAVAGLLILVILNLFNVTRISIYILVGVFLWLCVLKSGVHATLAGFAVGVLLPLSRSYDLNHALHPWVSFFILPLFALANAGVSLDISSLDILWHPVTLGIALGLFFGKQIGVMGASLLAIKFRLGAKPKGASLRHIYGVSVLTGIGFTMSLFIGTLAFADNSQLTAVRLGVLLGSFLSIILGLVVLFTSPKTD